MQTPFARIFSPLLSLSFLVIGGSFFMTYVSIALKDASYANFTIGLVAAAFYAGITVGSIHIERYISRVGHIRAFAAFSALSAILVLIQSLYLSPWLWFVCRLLSGFAVAVLYVVIESWLLDLSTPKNRGQILAIYMTVFYAAQSLSQFILKLGDATPNLPFVLSAIFIASAIIPVCMTRHPSPILTEPSRLTLRQLYKISPLSIIGCICSGMLLSAFYGLGPVFGNALNLSLNQIGQYMGLTIFGGMLLQYPFGHLSDYLDRRSVITIISIAAAISSILIAIFGQYSYGLLLLFSLLFGGAVFALYPLCISHATDYLTAKDYVAATGGLFLAYGIGAMIGPIIAPTIMHIFGKNGLYFYMTALSLSLTGFAFYRRHQRPPLPINEQGDYIILPQTTLVASELDPRTGPELESE